MKVTIEVPDAFINGALAEPASTYWASSASWSPTYRSGYVVDAAGDRPVRLSLSKASLQRAIVLMAARFPASFAALAGGTYDGAVGDVLLQLMAFGEVKYG